LRPSGAAELRQQSAARLPTGRTRLRHDRLFDAIIAWGARSSSCGGR
jgi:hypothetical protein